MYSIYLLRHCEYHNPRSILPGRLPVPLSETGRAQAHRLKEHFINKNIAKVYSSAVLRTRETAEIIADNKIPIIFDQRLLETASAYQGFWEENRHDDGFHFFSHRHELGGENLEEIQKRMTHFWDEVAKNTQENIIIVSHGDPLMALYQKIHQLPLVDDNAPEDDIPGWLEKGQFVEILVKDGRVKETKQPQTI